MRNLLIFFVCCVSMLIFSSCGSVTYYQALGNQPEVETGSNESEPAIESFDKEHFTTILKWGHTAGDGLRYRIMYDNDTKVKYFAACDVIGTCMTALYNADGTAQVYSPTNEIQPKENGNTTSSGNEIFGEGYFTIIEKWGHSSGNVKSYSVMYANDTKVKYIMIMDSVGRCITPLYNEDGSIQVYEK